MEGDVRRRTCARARSDRRASSCRSTRTTTTTGTSTASRAPTACAAFLASRGIELPEGDADDPPGAETVAGLGNRKNELVLEMIRERGRRGVRRLGRATSAPRATRACARAVVSSSANCSDVLEAAGIADLFERGVDGIVAGREHLKGKPAPDTFLSAARASSASSRREAAVFEDALAGVAAGRAGKFGIVVGVDRVGQADALARARRRRRRLRPRRAARGDDPAPRLRGRALVGAGDASSTSTCWRRRSRSSRSRTATSACAATSTRASRTACPARTSTRSTSCGRCRTPRPATATRSRARRSSTSRTARSCACSSTTSRSTSATASSSSHERVLDLRAGVARAPRRVDVARGRVGPRALDAPRLVRPARRRRDPLRGRADRRPGARRRAVGAGRERAGRAMPTSDPRAAAVLESPLQSEDYFDRGGRRGAAPLDEAERGPDGRGDGSRRRRARTEPTSSPRAARTSAA